MAISIGHDALSVFEVWHDAREFLATIIESKTVPPNEKECLLKQSLMGGVEDWHHMIACARSIQHSQMQTLGDNDENNILTILGRTFTRLDTVPESPDPWKETDRLISLAKELEKDIAILPPSLPASQFEQQKTTRAPRVRKQQPGTTSHYWVENPSPPSSRRNGPPTTRREPLVSFNRPTSHPKKLHQKQYRQECSSSTIADRAVKNQIARLLPSSDYCPLQALGDDVFSSSELRTKVQKNELSESPYFVSLAALKEEIPTKQPLAGLVSSIPFPPLTSPSFGIIQEELAHEPFWLLVAVTFLIKTNGQLAIPIFHKVKERFPSPSCLADSSNHEELQNMIRHLGLSNNRMAFIQRYARAFRDQPPRAGIRYRVRNYDSRDISPPLNNVCDIPEYSAIAPLTPDGEAHDLEAWEIGHMTQGKYAIDSWRIFCRDELLGRAEDWNGRGREPEFQPEWMRVRPTDKELRACLRWMWMREGWEWDPITGERTVLRADMMRAVNEERVEYDNTGALRMLEKPRTGAKIVREGIGVELS